MRCCGMGVIVFGLLLGWVGSERLHAQMRAPTGTRIGAGRIGGMNFRGPNLGTTQLHQLKIDNHIGIRTIPTPEIQTSPTLQTVPQPKAVPTSESYPTYGTKVVIPRRKAERRQPEVHLPQTRSSRTHATGGPSDPPEDGDSDGDDDSGDEDEDEVDEEEEEDDEEESWLPGWASDALSWGKGWFVWAKAHPWKAGWIVLAALIVLRFLGSLLD